MFPVKPLNPNAPQPKQRATGEHDEQKKLVLLIRNSEAAKLSEYDVIPF